MSKLLIDVRKTATVAAPVVLGLCLLAGCQNPADGKVEAEVSDPAPAHEEPMAAMEGATFVITDASTIGFTGSKITGSHEGGFKVFEGKITVGEAGPTGSSVEIMIDATSLWADNEKLTGHLQSADFFGVETYPTARFTSSAITESDTGYEMTGELELHGVTKQITFPVTIEIGEDQVSAQAEFVIKRFDFKIEYAGMKDDLIRDEVVVKLDLVAVPHAG